MDQKLQIVLAHPLKVNMEDIRKCGYSIPIVRVRKGFDAPPLQLVEVDKIQPFESLSELLENMGGFHEDVQKALE